MLKILLVGFKTGKASLISRLSAKVNGRKKGATNGSKQGELNFELVRQIIITGKLN